MTNSPARTAPLDGMTVLIVEDEIFIAMALELYVKRAGVADVEIAGTLEEAENTLAKHDFDAAILDIRLPDGNSFGIGRDLLTSNVPVVFHSGHADVAEQSKLPLATFCPKPTTEQEIIAAILHARDRLKDYRTAEA